MAAQLICNQWVAGSTPVTSSKKRTGKLKASPVRFFEIAQKYLKMCHKLTNKRTHRNFNFCIAGNKHAETL